MDGFKLNKVIPLFFIALLLGACASAPQQKLTIETKQNVKSIALIRVIEPENYIAANIASLKSFFIGAFNKDNEIYTKRFTENMAKSEIKIGRALLQELERGLKNKGYEVTILDIELSIKENGEYDYSNIQTDADAILNVWFRAAGYVSPPNSIGYEPWLMVSSRMVSAKDKSQIYFQAFNYAARLGRTIENIIYYDQIGTKEFHSFDEIVEGAPEAGKELMLGIPLISNGILNEL